MGIFLDLLLTKMSYYQTFIEDPQSGIYYFMVANPVATGGISNSPPKSIYEQVKEP
jgi:hypothetical protein